MIELKLACMSINTLRCPLAVLILLGWNLIITYLLGTGKPDLDLCRNLMKYLVESYPNVCFFTFRFIFRAQ